MINFSTLQGLDIPEGPVKSLAIDGVDVWHRTKFNYVSLGDSIAAGCNMYPELGYGVLANEFNPADIHPMNDGASLFGVTMRNNSQTEIINNSYTDLIRRNLEDCKFGKGRVKATSFAMSGSTNEKLVEALQRPELIAETSQADLTTISIGANSILMPAIGCLADYLVKGDIIGFEHIIYENLQHIAGKAKDYYDSNGELCTYPGIDFTKSTQSYKYILDRLTKGVNTVDENGINSWLPAINSNPNAKYIFTEVFNPYKYLHIDKGGDGFFDSFCKMLPEMPISLDMLVEIMTGMEINTGYTFSLTNILKQGLTNEYSPINLILDRVNSLSDMVEVYVDELNSVIKNTVDTYGNSNVFVAETKKVFDSIPDKPVAPAVKQYYNSNMVSCMYSTGFDFMKDTQWDRIWKNHTSKFSPTIVKILNKFGIDQATLFWFEYIYFTEKPKKPTEPPEGWEKWKEQGKTEEDWSNFQSEEYWSEDDPYKYVKYNSPTDLSNPLAWIRFVNNIEELVEIRWDILLKDICIDLVFMKIIEQDIDPHPRAGGHQAMYRAFADILRKPECLDIPNMESLTRYNITYDANSGSGTEIKQVVGLDNSIFVRLNPPDVTPPDGYCFTGWGLTDNSTLPFHKDEDEPNKLKYFYANDIASDCTIYAQWAKAINLTYYKVCTLSKAHKLGLALAGKSISNETGPITNILGTPYYLTFNVIHPNEITESLPVGDKFSETMSGYDGCSPTITRKIPNTAQIEIGLVNKGDGDKCAVYADNVRKEIGKEILYRYNPNNELLPDLNMCFIWRTEGDVIGLSDYMQSYWECGIQDMTIHHKTVTFNSNNGTNAIEQQVFTGFGSCPATGMLNDNTFVHPTIGYRFIGWNTKPDGTGTSYTNGNDMSLDSDITLYAQWSDQCIVKFKHSNYTGALGKVIDGIDIPWTGHSECYALYINGVEMKDFSGFNKDTTSYQDVCSVPYGSQIVVNVKDYNGDGLGKIAYDEAYCGIYMDGVSQQGEGAKQDLWYGFTLTSDVEIDFRWKIAGLLTTLNARSWEDCYITTFDASYQQLSQPYSISYNANGGTGSMAPQKILKMNNLPVVAAINKNSFAPASGYRFIGWVDQDSQNYSNAKIIEMDKNLTLSAVWSNQCIIRYKHTKHTDWANLTSVGISTDPNQYQLWIDSTKLNQLDGYSEEVFSVPYGSPLGVIVGSYSSNLPTFADTYCSVYIDGNRKQYELGQIAYNLEGGVTSDLEIDFQWHTTGVELDANSGSKTSYEECHITTFDASYQQLTQPYSITFKANGGQGSMATQQVLRLNNLPVRALLNHNAFTRSGLYYRGWNTSASDSGTSYSDREIIQLTSDLVLYAMWKYLLIFKHSEDSQYHGPSDTGPQENYGLYIEGTDQDYDNDLSDFSNPPREYYVLPGTLIKVNVKSKYDKAYSYISWNGTIPKDNPNYSAVNKTSEGKGTDVTYIFNLNNNVTLHYEWTVRGVDALGVQLNPESYWNCYITTN